MWDVAVGRAGIRLASSFCGSRVWIGMLADAADDSRRRKIIGTTAPRHLASGRPGSLCGVGGPDSSSVVRVARVGVLGGAAGGRAAR